MQAPLVSTGVLPLRAPNLFQRLWKQPKQCCLLIYVFSPKIAVLISLSKRPDALDCPNSFLLADWYLVSLAASHSSSSVFLNVSICLLRGVLGRSCCSGFSLVVARRLLIVLASVVAEPGLWGRQASVDVTPQLLNTGSVAVVYGLGCSMTRGIFPDQGSNLCLLHSAGRFFTTEPPEKPSSSSFLN